MSVLRRRRHRRARYVAAWQRENTVASMASAMPRRLDGVDAAARDPTRRVHDQRQFRDGVVQRRSSASVETARSTIRKR